MTDLLTKISFDSEEYTVEQNLVRNKYSIYSDGKLVAKAKQKLFKMKEEFPFVNEKGEEVFSIKADQMLDLAGDYKLIDSATDETVAILSKKLTLFKHVWKVKSPEGRLLAKIESQNAFLEALRSLSDILSLLPRKYDITDSEENLIGTIEGQFSIRDRYNVKVDRDVEGREAIIASATTIDTLEGN